MLEVGSHLAKNGLKTSAQDLVTIRLQLQQLQALKASLQAVLAPPPPPPTPSPSDSQSSAYAALLSQAAQFAMSAISATKRPPTSGVSTAVSSKQSSPLPSPPSATAQQELSREEFKNLLVRVVEKGSLQQGELGMAASSLSPEWRRMFPSIPPLEHFMERFGTKSLKQLLLADYGGRIVAFYATLPSPQLRVATAQSYARFGASGHLTTLAGGSPLISPTSTCSFTSDVVPVAELPPPSLERAVTELVLNAIKQNQTRAIREKAKAGNAQFGRLAAVLDAVEDSLKRPARKLESKRPPPIETGATGTIAPLAKQFAAIAASVLVDAPFVAISDLVSSWTSTGAGSLEEALKNTAAVRVAGDKCTLTALTSPGALVNSVFALSDATVWTDANEALVAAVRKAVVAKPPAVTPAQLNELSATLFKSIMAGGAKSAKECASALKTLAAKDPKSIHQIVSSHISQLNEAKQRGGVEDAARAFVESLMEKGRTASLAVTSEAAPPGLKPVPFVAPDLVQAVMPAQRVEYTREALMAIRADMEASGRLNMRPKGLKPLKHLVKESGSTAKESVAKESNETSGKEAIPKESSGLVGGAGPQAEART